MGAYRGIAYPICKHSLGLFHNTSDISQIKADVATIILTKARERVMELGFGIAWDNINFSQPKELVINEIRHMVANAMVRWEKRVQVEDVQAEVKVDEDNNRLSVVVTIFFIDPRNLQHLEEITIEKYIGGIDGRGMPF